MSPRAVIGLIIVLVLLIGGITTIKSLVSHLDANEVLVVQIPFTGTLNCYTTPGAKPRWFGTSTFYKKREQFSFSIRRDQGKPNDESLKVRFNDGGHANVSGVISWEMPNDCIHIIKLHTLYGSQHSIEQQLVRPTIERSMYLTGPLMSSAESYASRRNQFLQFFEDQVRDGIYLTQIISVRAKDLVSGQETTIQKVDLVMEGANIKRQGPSPFTEFGIQILPPAINEIKYDDVVEKQIAEQQKAIMQVQTAQANAREAEQRALTATKNGEAEAAKARWEQEVIKAKMVTQAQQELEVATLNAKAAEQYKIQQIRIGEGDGERRKLVMAADGALEKKLEAYVKTQEFWAGAFKDFKGQLVPQFSTVSGAGAGGGTSGNAALDFMQLMGMKAAKDLAVDAQPKGQSK